MTIPAIPQAAAKPGLDPRIRLILLCVCLIAILVLCYQFRSMRGRPHDHPDWHVQVARAMPLLGHRNWILIVDSAYPLQTSPGLETIETNASQTEVLRSVLGSINSSIQVRPLITMDAELPFVPEAEAHGADAYRADIATLLKGYTIESVPHEKVLADIAEVAKTYHVLILKTNMTIPYTSVFIRLDCKYWSADSEARLRAAMSAK